MPIRPIRVIDDTITIYWDGNENEFIAHSDEDGFLGLYGRGPNECDALRHLRELVVHQVSREGFA